MSWHCKLCSMEFCNDVTLQTHLAGKKHLRRAQVTELIGESNCPSKQCETCSMKFQDMYALEGHLKGKKHLQKVQQLEKIKSSIFVSSLPKFIPPVKLIEFFAQYGVIKMYTFSQNYLIIEFAERSSAEAVLSKPVWMCNVRLDVRKRRPYNNVSKLKTQRDSISYNNINHIFEEETTFNDQLATFLNTIQLTDAEIETRYESVCIKLDEIFKVIFPKCKTYMFGSTQMNLGFKECDLDIYMDIGEPIRESTNISTMRYCKDADTWTMEKILNKVKHIMRRSNHIFSNIISIPKAKIPIIKFIYVKTNISCDISFKNSSGKHKSNLIKHCISLDPRIRPLVMLIKYWARHFYISGSGKLSNYALVLLIIFYLQQPSVKIIPPLFEFQKNCLPQLMDGWQVNFNETTQLPPITNTDSIPQLCYGFFTFYSTFVFETQIICPLDGLVHTKSEFKDPENLPECMDTYKVCLRMDKNFQLQVDRKMCVQDPIELMYNVTASTQPSSLKAFVRYCTIGAEVCKKTSQNDYKDLLKHLFSTVMPNVS